MATHLVYRTPYIEKNQKFYRQFPEQTVLEWFQSLWKFYDDDADVFYGNVKQYIGTNIYGFWGPFRMDMAYQEDRSNPVPPASSAELSTYLLRGYVNEVQVISEHAVQVLTDDDELDAAYYIFDDYYAASHADIVRYLIHDSWELPTSFVASPHFDPPVIDYYEFNPGKGEGAIYCIIASDWGAGGNYSNLKDHVIKIPGVRLDDGLVEHLLSSTPDDSWLEDFLWWRTQIDEDERTLSRMFANFGQLPAFHMTYLDTEYSYDSFYHTNHRVGRAYLATYFAQYPRPSHHLIYNDPAALSFFQESKHFFQASIYVESWKEHPTFDLGTNFPVYYHYIFFDDLWASSNPHLAYSLLRYGSRWDVLA